MRSSAKLVVLGLFLAACGDNDGVEVRVDAAPDAIVVDGAIDAPVIDAPVIDAPVIDAPAIDASPIDAPAIDAPAIDAPAIDAPAIDASVIDAPVIDAPAIDAPMIDAPMIDAPPALGTHLLITEVKTTDNSEFIEIYNPTSATVNLRNYYLTDHQSYFLLPAVIAGNQTVVTDATDFLVRFPVGATLAPGGVITVATDAVGFETGFTSVPTYTIQELGNSVAMEVVWATTGTSNPGLTNAGEMVALLFWDGASDNVKDVDLMNAGGAPTAANTFIAKTATDGPDADAVTTAYAVDVPNAVFDMATDTPNGTSYKRIALEGANETHAGTGNGITGDDETSEAVRTTWDSQATAANYTAGTPGAVPASLLP